MTKDIKFVQEDLSTGTGTEGSLLIAKKIHDRLIEAVDKALLPRELAAIFVGPGGIPGSSLDVNLVTADSMNVKAIGEGADIWLSEPEFTSDNIKPLKYGLRVNITREMMEDSQFDLLSVATRMAGKEFAENETNLVITALDGAANTVSGAAAATMANVTRMIQYLHDSDYTATDLLIGPEVLQDLQLIDTFIEADKKGSDDFLMSGFLGRILGMQVHLFSANAAPSTTYSKYAYVIDRSEAYIIVEKRPVTTEAYTLPQNDKEGVAITQRLAVALLRSSAVAKLTTS